MFKFGHFMMLKRKFARLKLGKGELLLLLLGVVTFFWLHGDLLFFWDTIIPFQPASDIHLYLFTWNQGISAGVPNIANEWLSYFLSFYILHTILGLTIPLSQAILIYLLFVFSGITMYRLIKFLINENYSSIFSLPSFIGALIYMFNFYVAYYLLSDFYESWFIYSLLPLIILIFLLGIKKSIEKRTYWQEILYLVLLFGIVSVSFWEPPYLIWAIFLMAIFSYNSFLTNKNKIDKKSWLLILRFFAISIFLIIITGLWYIYTYIYTTFSNYSQVSSSGVSQVSYNNLLSSFLSSGNTPFLRLLNIVAIYPQIAPIPNNLYEWQNFYFFIDFIFILSVFAFYKYSWVFLLQMGFVDHHNQ